MRANLRHTKLHKLAAIFRRKKLFFSLFNSSLSLSLCWTLLYTDSNFNLLLLLRLLFHLLRELRIRPCKLASNARALTRALRLAWLVELMRKQSRSALPCPAPHLVYEIPRRLALALALPVVPQQMCTLCVCLSACVSF